MVQRPQLDGKSAVVTGGSRGIGLSIASALVGHGASVAIAGISREHLDRAQEELSHRHAAGATRVLAVAADVREYGEVERLMARAAEAFGRLDILVNSAGVGLFAEVASMSPETWRRVLDTNVTGVFQCCHAALPHLRKSGGGWIINISSLASKNPFAGGGAYCASKAALNAFTDVLMQEVRYDDIRVSCILPGSVRTEFGGRGPDQAPWKLAPDDVAQVVLDLVAHEGRSLPSRVELRPSKPKK
jgi:NAD(P)-dependent dehydrogenase (short-subunit alcohol dehydrogenase family)